MPPEEVTNNLLRFKALMRMQKAVNVSRQTGREIVTRKGVVLAKKVEALFHVVPPSIYSSRWG